MEKFITAFATDDGESFIDRHFGDATFYNVYEISSTEVKFLKKISNSTEDDDDESGHGALHKARGITGMLKKEGVSMAVSRVFGPNLKRIKKKFLCVIAKEGSIADNINKLQDHFPELIAEWSNGVERNFIRL